MDNVNNREKLEEVLSYVLDASISEDKDKVYMDVIPAVKELYQLHCDERRYDLEEQQIALELKKLDIQAASEKEERDVKVKVAKMEVAGEMVTEALKTVGTGVLFAAGLGASMMFEKSYGKSISRSFQFFARLIPWGR